MTFINNLIQSKPHSTGPDLNWLGVVELGAFSRDRYMTWDIPKYALPELRDGQRLRLTVNVDSEPAVLNIKAMFPTPLKELQPYFWLGQAAA